MDGKLITSLLAAGAASAVTAAVAIAAPVASTPPTISGKPNLGETLTCNKGTWSPDAVSFTYAWAISGGSTFANGQTLKVPNTTIDYDVFCIVTAKDAQGNATPASSAQVQIGEGIPTVKITKASVKKGVVTISGIAGPAAARKKGPDGASTVVLDRELTSKTDLQQISNPKVVRSKNGSFTISGHDVKGTHTYVVEYNPSEGSGYNQGTATRKLTVR